MYPTLKQTIIVAMFCFCLGVEAQSAKRPFSVRDSIEMSTFSDPYTRNANATCQQSPDGKHIFFVTTRGLIDRNRLRSTIWLFDTASLHIYLDRPEARPPHPRALVERTAVPRVLRSNSYGSVITKAQWSSDSSSILFLSEEADRKQHLYRVSIGAGTVQTSTGPMVNVENYSESAGTVVYSTKGKPGLTTAKPQSALNGSASRLTGLSLTAILYPELLENPDSVAIPRDLWVRKENGSSVQINRNTGVDEWHIPSALSTQFRPAISPDGHAVIAAMPARNIPAEWKTYRFASDLYRFEKLNIDKDQKGTVWSWPWQYVYVDLDGGDVTPLVNAPSAMQAAYYDPFQTVWSADGRRVLFTNSFMPASRNKNKEGGIPCAVAVFTLSNHTTNCITFARYPKSNTHLVSVSFGTTSSEVVVKWGDGGTIESETYHEENHGWSLTQRMLPPSGDQRVLSVFVKQDIGVSATLWATDLATGRSKQVWDPNPQFKSLQLGEASVYRWKDSTGYEWTAGLVKPFNYVPGHRYPLVIQTHGFFNEHEFLVDGSFTTGFAAQPLAASGFMVLQMGDRTDRHMKPSTEEATLMATAFRDAIEHLDRDALIDPSKVGIIGFSRSSWYVETALIEFPQMFRAATIIDGVDESYMTYLLFCIEYQPCRIDHDATNGGPPFGKRIGAWLDSADGFNLNKVQTPLRIEAIGPMSILGEWEIYSSLSMQGKPVDLIYIAGGQHILQKPLERYASQQGNVDWFHKWLSVR